MPELPEVETVRQMLLKTLPKTEIKDVVVLYPKIIQNLKKEDFINELRGAKIIDIKRQGKYLIFEFDKIYLISHLRMEGKYFFNQNYQAKKHDHLLFIWEEGTLVYNDTRKFGTMHLFSKDLDIKKIPPLNKLALDANDSRVTQAYLEQKLAKKNIYLKTSLLDQSIISGLGNIYVDEVLFRAKISPLRKANTLSSEEISQIIEEAKKTLNEAIALGGTTIRTFTSGTIHGRFQNELKIHHQQVCPSCENKVKKIFVGGRGTYYCNNCQK